MRRPPALSPGATLRIIAPSSPFDRERFDRGHTLLSQRYRVEFSPSVLARDGFLAGTDAARRTDLVSALDDASVGGLVAARGGYGATRLLADLDVGQVQRADKWLVGFSDLTALHALWARAGLCSIHGPMVCSLAEAPDSYQLAFFDLLEGQTPPPVLGLSRLCGGRASGRLFGGNLTVIAALVGTPFMPPLDDVVLVLEDVGERPYRIDRMLTTMLQAGVFDGVRAIVLGQFTDCARGPEGTSVEQVLAERLAPLRIPVLGGAPVGHIDGNLALLLGARVHVDADSGWLHWEIP